MLFCVLFFFSTLIPESQIAEPGGQLHRWAERETVSAPGQAQVSGPESESHRWSATGGVQGRSGGWGCRTFGGDEDKTLNWLEFFAFFFLFVSFVLHNAGVESAKSPRVSSVECESAGVQHADTSERAGSGPESGKRYRGESVWLVAIRKRCFWPGFHWHWYSASFFSYYNLVESFYIVLLQNKKGSI